MKSCLMLCERAPVEDDDCSSSVRERMSGVYRKSDTSDGYKNKP
ncbi:hypothetical protein [Campylobacter concisus]|nr:hypothetical protein [Campylobacter concisus]